MLRQHLSQQLKQLAYPLTRRFISNCSVVEGVLQGGGEQSAQPREVKHSPQPLRLLLIHNCLFNQELRRRLFETSREVARFHLSTFQLGRLLRHNPHGVDFISAVLPPGCARAFDGLPHLVTREEVRQLIPVPESWETLRQGFSRKKRQITNQFELKSGLTCRISRDLQDLEFFYHQMHLPLIRRRYGSQADLDDWGAMRRAFDQGFLLFVLADGRPVAAALTQRADNHLVFRRTGVLDGAAATVRRVAQTALYYFQLRLALEQGLDAVDTMNSFPFLDDGVFRHKADWGALPLPDERARRRVFLVPSPSAAQNTRFFQLNPLVIEDERGLSAVIGDSTGSIPPGSGPPDRWNPPFPLAGLHGLQIWGPDGLRSVDLREVTAEVAPATGPRPPWRNTLSHFGGNRAELHI